MELFQESMNDVFEGRRTSLMEEIKNLSDEQLAEAAESICYRLASKYDFVDAPEILPEDVSRDEAVIARGGQEVVIRVYIPFKGDRSSFSLYHSAKPMSSGSFDVRENELISSYRLGKNEIDRLQEKIDKDVEFIRRYLAHVRDMVPRFNKSLRQFAMEAIEHCKYEHTQRREAAAKVENLGIKIRKRNDGMEKVIVPVKRKSITVQPMQEEQNEPYQFLEMAAYEDILKTISSMAHVMERTPSVFVEMNEEPLRTIMLVALNGIYEGKATGETFNGEGKTDILIRIQDQNVFIAECLMWKGASYLQGKMDDQLFRYAMWRDSKLALIIFNRGTNFSHVIKEMKRTVGDHSGCIRELDYKHESGARYLFRRDDDPEKTFTLTVLAFNVPE